MFNRAFVAVRCEGYLRRKPEADGYQTRPNYLNANPADSDAMIDGFMNSVEQQFRLDPTS